MKNSKNLRYGFTTGSVAAFAAKAAACDLLLGFVPKDISVMTPKQIPYSPSYKNPKRGIVEVRKFAGDDPDVTDGMTIRAIVSVESVSEEQKKETTLIDRETEDTDFQRSNKSDYKEISSSDNSEGGVIVAIDGGKGIGRVTKPGLDQPVGNAAINHVPRQMITENVLEVCKAADFTGKINVIIEADGGEEIAKKTFNPRLGIVGGISILGTTGIVEPMSDEALVDTIRVEIHQRSVLGEKRLLMAFGNYGQEFLLEDYGIDLDTAVMCSNFIKDALTIAADEGFKEILLVGHLGKIVKVAGGFSNTHSKYGDCRMELLTSALLKSKADCTVDDARKLSQMNTTEEAADFLAEKGYLSDVMSVIMSEIHDTISRWIPDVEVHLMIYTVNQRLIGRD